MNVQSASNTPRLELSPNMCFSKNPVTGELEWRECKRESRAELLEKFKAARDARVQQLAASKKSLTTEEVNELVEDLYKKYDPHNMTLDDYKCFMKELVSRGALNSTEAEWMDGISIMVDPTAPCSIMQEIPGERLAYSIESADGDAMLYLYSMKRKYDSGKTETDKAMSNAVSKADAVLRAIAKRREQEGIGGGSISETAAKRAQLSNMLQTFKSSLYNGYASTMTLKAVRTRVVEEIDEIMFSALDRSTAQWRRS